MSSIRFATMCLTACLSSANSLVDSIQTFSAFVAQYNKDYSNIGEANRALKNILKNKVMVDAANANPKTKATF